MEQSDDVCQRLSANFCQLLVPNCTGNCCPLSSGTDVKRRGRLLPRPRPCLHTVLIRSALCDPSTYIQSASTRTRLTNMKKVTQNHWVQTANFEYLGRAVKTASSKLPVFLPYQKDLLQFTCVFALPKRPTPTYLWFCRIKKTYSNLPVFLPYQKDVLQLTCVFAVSKRPTPTYLCFYRIKKTYSNLPVFLPYQKDLLQLTCVFAVSKRPTPTYLCFCGRCRRPR